MVRPWLKKPLEKHAVHGARPSLHFTRQKWPAQRLELRNVRSLTLWNLLSDQGIQPLGSATLKSPVSGCDMTLSVSSWLGPLARLLLGDPLSACMPLTMGSSPLLQLSYLAAKSL